MEPVLPVHLVMNVAVVAIEISFNWLELMSMPISI